jgi:hypothetical protein
MATYIIHNTTRSPLTKATRIVNAGHMNSVKNLFIGGSIRVVRGNPVEVSENFVRNNRAQLLEYESKGLIQLTDANRRPVRVQTIAPEVTPAVVQAASVSEPEKVSEPVVEEPPVTTPDPVPSSPAATEEATEATEPPVTEQPAEEKAPEQYSGKKHRRH